MDGDGRSGHNGHSGLGILDYFRRTASPVVPIHSSLRASAPLRYSPCLTAARYIPCLTVAALQALRQNPRHNLHRLHTSQAHVQTLGLKRKPGMIDPHTM